MYINRSNLIADQQSLLNFSFEQCNFLITIMNVLKKLENTQPNKPYHGFAKLNKGCHQIVNFKVVKNKFGKKADGSNMSIMVELKDEVMFLPQYFRQKLTDEDLKELNESIEAKEKIYLYFGGQNEDKK